MHFLFWFPITSPQLSSSSISSIGNIHIHLVALRLACSFPLLKIISACNYSHYWTESVAIYPLLRLLPVLFYLSLWFHLRKPFILVLFDFHLSAFLLICSYIFLYASAILFPFKCSVDYLLVLVIQRAPVLATVHFICFTFYCSISCC